MRTVITGRVEHKRLGVSETDCLFVIDAPCAAGAAQGPDVSQPGNSASQFQSQPVRLPGNLTSRVRPADRRK